MTVAAELALVAQRTEYFVTIEGVGWPTNGLSGDLSGGFDGVVWTTADLDGDLATQLGCTVYHGLDIKSSISESIDPRTVSYSPSGIRFDIVDHDDWWLANLTPRKQGYLTTLNAELGWGLTSIQLVDGTDFAASSVAWIGGRERVLLGSKGGGPPHTYTGCTRGYTGTHQGSILNRPDYGHGWWPAGTSVQSIPWWWHDRRVVLWAHVPGESSDNCLCLWFGRLRNISNGSAGIVWSFGAVADLLSQRTRIRKSAPWNVYSRMTAYPSYEKPTEQILNAKNAANGAMRMLEFREPSTSEADAAEQVYHGYELAAAYSYRNEPGGIAGLVSTWDAGSVQAIDFNSRNDRLMSFVHVDDAAYLMLWLNNYVGNTDPHQVTAEMLPYAGQDAITQGESRTITADANFAFDGLRKCRFLLDNLHSTKEDGRFIINGSYSRHPIDVGLMIMTSMDREIHKQVTNPAGGSTQTVLSFPSHGFPANALVGKALISVDQTENNWMESQEITANDANTITVSPGFTLAPTANKEFQVRNTIYDHLPLGWGMGIDSADIDFSAFEDIRDDQIPNATVGNFMLGVEDEVDLWQIVNEFCFRPWGVLAYFDYNQRKITAKYIGPTPEDATIEDYTAITRDDIIDPGGIDLKIAKPIGLVDVNVRAKQNIVLAISPPRMRDGAPNQPLDKIIEPQTQLGPASALMNGRKDVIHVVNSQANIAFANDRLQTVTFDALLNTSGPDAASLATRMVGFIGEYNVPPPVWTTRLDLALYPSLPMGTMVTISWTGDPAFPVNPYTGTRGWTNVVGRVIGRSYPLQSGVEFVCTIELLLSKRIRRLAPAAEVTGDGNDAHGDYFTLKATTAQLTDYVMDTDDNDMHHFTVGDRIELRDESGAYRDGPYAIIGFDGAPDLLDDPTAADTHRVYVANAAIGVAAVATDYITFAAWSNSNTTRMDLYSAYANASGLLAGNDNAGVYR